MKRYCIVNEIKKEYLGQYIDIHRNAWPDLLETLKNAGTQEEILYIYNNLAIAFFECDDIDMVFMKLEEEDVVNKWNATVVPWFERQSGTLEKIFDLNQQLNGKLEQN